MALEHKCIPFLTSAIVHAVFPLSLIASPDPPSLRTAEVPHQRSSKHGGGGGITLGTPLSGRRHPQQQDASHNNSPSNTLGTPRSSRSFLIGSGGSTADLKGQALDEWEAKLLGKKSAGESKR